MKGGREGELDEDLACEPVELHPAGSFCRRPAIVPPSERSGLGRHQMGVR